MADDGFAGSTFTFGGTAQADMRSMSFSDNANEVDVTVAGSGAHQYVQGIPDYELTVELIGRAAISRGSTGAVSIAWNDGSTDSAGGLNFIVTSRETSGGIDEPILTTITLKPTPTAE